MKALKGTTRCYYHPLIKREKIVCGEPKAQKRGFCTIKVDNTGDKCFRHDDRPKCNAKLTRGKFCSNRVTNEDDKCLTHGGVKEEKKDNRTILKCPECGADEEWKSMNLVSYSNYKLSSLGRVYNTKTGKLLKEDKKPTSKGYIRCELTNNIKNGHNKGVHTWQGGVFLDIKLVYGKEYNPITVDHIDGIKSHNWTCCNLRATTIQVQQLNRNMPQFRQGRTVLKMSLEGEILEEYISMRKAAFVLNIYRDTVKRHCESRKEIDGYTLRFLNEDHIGIQEWHSSKLLYPEYRSSFEVSREGWIRRANGVLFKGSFDGYYFVVGILYGKLRFVHDLVYEIITGQKIPDGYEISHINCRGHDNRFSNLELTTQ
uniref:HNH endonuclease n=1 Tax=Pithovirus LCPAC406 TaxID=2506599 RepID=A0A481ZGA9_9VIRU|nr:MAG: HNH endonuclease [Pithovirus LCPAC406]